MKSRNPKLSKDQIVKDLGMSKSTLQRHTPDLYMLSLYRIPPNTHKIKQKLSNCEHDLERPQMPSKDLK